MSTAIAQGQTNRRFEKGGEKKQTPAVENRDSQPGSQAKSQKETSPRSEFWQNVHYGGNLGLSFGTFTNIMANPQVSYVINDNLFVGTGYLFNYFETRRIFTSQGFQELDEPITDVIHGPNFFGNFVLLEQFTAGMQLEFINHDVPFVVGNEVNFRREWTPVLFLQGGFFQRFAGGGSSSIGLRYNVLHDNFSPYGNAIQPYFALFF